MQIKLSKKIKKVLSGFSISAFIVLMILIFGSTQNEIKKLYFLFDFTDTLCYTDSNKSHRNGKNQVSPTWCHQIHVKAVLCRVKSCYPHRYACS